MPNLSSITKRVPLASIHHDPANVRTHGERNLEAIANSLRSFGQVEPLIVQKSTGKVIGGNGRLTAMRSLGWAEADVVELDIDDTRATALGIALNRTAELAEWDDAGLAALLQSLPTDAQLAAGWDEGELDALLAELNADKEVQEDEAPAVKADAVTRTGDVWLMGEHRVLCGDSTNEADWYFIDGNNLLCFTSPPYNLGGSFRLSGSSKAESGNAYDGFNDSQSSEDWRRMCDGMLTAALSKCECAVFNVQPLAGNRRDILRWIADRDEYRDIATWDKGHGAPQMAEGVMASRFEWLVVFGRGKSSRRIPLSSWRGTIQNVYSAPPQRSNEHAEVHGATFPVHLPSWVIGDLCNRASGVVDCCMGTGTTLIAAEQLGRRCYGIEIAPVYVDVIVRRWQNFTKRQATLEATGQTFEEVAAERGVTCPA